MRKITMMVGFVLSTGLLLTNCVKNEESDGVKALREAQAGYYDALAQAEVLTAEADAAYTNAEAAHELAYAATQNAIAAQERAQAKIDSLNAVKSEAQTDADIAVIEAQLQVQLANKEAALIAAQNSIETAKLKAEADLLDAQKALVAAQDAYQKALQDADDAMVNYYYGLYSDALDEVNSLQREINELTWDIASDKSELAYLTTDESLWNETVIANEILELNIDVTNYQGDIVDLQSEKSVLEEEVTFLNSILSGQNTNVDAKLTTIKATLSTLRQDSASLKVEMDDASAAYDLAYNAYYDYYYDVYTPMYNTVSDAPYTIYGYQTNIAYYNYQKAVKANDIAESQLQIDEYQANLDAANALLNEYLINKGLRTSNVISYQNAYFNAIEDERVLYGKYQTAYSTYLVLQADADAYPADPNKAQAASDASDAADDAWDAYVDSWSVTSAASQVYSNAVSELMDAQSLEENGYWTVYNYTSNISYEVAQIEDATNSYYEYLENIEDYEARLVALQAEYDEAVAGIQEAYDLLDEYSAARDAADDLYVEVSNEYYNIIDDIAVQRDYAYALNYDVNSLENYIESLEDDIAGIDQDIRDIEDSIADIQSDIAHLQVDITGRESYIAWFTSEITVMETELANLQAKLAIKEGKVVEYKAALDAEIAD